MRVQLLDATTGQVLEDVDVITSADSVTFADGETFQQKLDSGKLRGATGDKGATGGKGDKGDKGEKGDNAIWHFVNSTGAPSNSLGTIGDWAINTAGQTYEKTGASAWTARANIKGATGGKGDKGDKGESGDKVKYGTTLANATEVSLFLKKI
ncbi:hypothetical protein [Tissierella carlieri]|uniref:hypothetical protein n=1 Tax=Tissierella carlieri TaxID=689904 RepID=UPI001C1066CE|nr:hypothetical protein [Tissierella carlieri]